jgi:CopA family copper-resistance protein
MVAGGVVAGFDLWRWPALAIDRIAEPTELAGSHFELVIGETPVNFTGRNAMATAVNGLIPGPLLKWREGDTVTIAVTNRLKTPTSIHWHGIRLPAEMDGVPGVSFAGIEAGETYTYRFPVKQSGTYWYHSHSRFQEQKGHYGPLVIEPRGADPLPYDRDYVIMLSDWTDEDPEAVFSNLKRMSGYYNYHQRTAGTFLSDLGKEGLGATLSDRLMWGAMNMSPTDILDVSGATYTYLVNGRPPAANWTALFSPRERVRLRFINGSSMSIFDVRIPGLPMTVVQTDGNEVEPVTIDEFRISVAETYDVIVQPRDASAYTIFAQSEDRTGYARATLAPRSGMTAPIPPMDPRPLLTMADMGMAMGNMGGMKMDDDHPSATGTAAETGMESMPGMKMGDTSGMGEEKPAGVTAPGKSSMASASLSMPFPQPGPGTGPGSAPSVQAPAVSLPAQKAIALRVGPQVDNVAEAATDRLADPGIGLNGNGRRVLTYADLRTRYRGTDPRAPEREIEIHLTGNMERFIWGFNGAKYSSAGPIQLKFGERVRFILVNDTMMAHPIHLHGMWSELENGHGEFRPYKHTINVKPGERLSYLVSADTPGRWAFHCHLLYHMEAGMFRTVIVS